MKRFTLILQSLAVIATAIFASCGGRAAEKTNENAVEAAAEKAVILLQPGEDLPMDGKLPLVVDFNATWCGPCHRFAPVFDKVAEQYFGRARFISVDVDANQQLAAQFNVRTIPMVVYIKPDSTYFTTVGLIPESQFVKAVEAVLK